MSNLNVLIFDSFKHHAQANTLENKSNINSSTKILDSKEAALKTALQQCQKEIKRCKRWNFLPRPKYFEHVAMLSRQTKMYKNEIAICKLYIDLANQCQSKRIIFKKITKKKADTLSKPFFTRMNNAKNLNQNNGLEVKYI